MACMCALALNVACSSRSNSENVISADTTALQGTIVETEGSKKYENEYYSLTVPNDWKITESIYDRRPGLEKFTPNEVMTLSQHEVCFEGDNVLVKIVKSNYKFDKPIEFYAGLSVLSKGLMDAGEYNGVIEQTYPSIFIVRLDDDTQRKVTYSYSDVLTKTVQILFT